MERFDWCGPIPPVGQEAMSQCRDAELSVLLNGDGFHQRPEVLVDCLFLGVSRLGKAAQKHRRSSDVLASPSKLWGIVSFV